MRATSIQERRARRRNVVESTSNASVPRSIHAPRRSSHLQRCRSWNLLWLSLVAPSIAHVVAGGAGALVDEALGGDASAVSILKRLGDLCRRGGASCDLQRAVATHAAKLARHTLAAPDERVGLEVLKLLDALTAIVAAAFAPPQSVEAIPTDAWDAFHSSDEAPTNICEVKGVEDAFEEALNGDDERFASCAARASTRRCARTRDRLYASSGCVGPRTFLNRIIERTSACGCWGT